MNLKYNTKYTIQTPTGFKPFKAIRKLTKPQYYIIKTNECEIQCSIQHPFIINNQIVRAKELSIGDSFSNGQIIIQMELIKQQKQLFDIMDVEDGNVFLINDGIISHNCSFASSGDTVINDLVLNSLQQESCQDPIQMYCNEKLWIWKHPQQEKNYIVSADVARGDGEDYSAFHIICVQDDQQVGQYKGKINTKDYGNLLVQWSTKYNNAQLIVQNANIGWAVLQQIIDLQYKNVYYHKKDFKYVDTQLHSKMKRTKSADLQKDILGFSTTSKTRPLIIQKTMLLIQTKQFIIRSKRLINQLRTFIWINGRAQAMGSYNDDLTMSLCIGVWVRNTSYMLKKQASNLTRQRLANINSGLNIKGLTQKGLVSGFYSGANTTTDKNVVSVGDQNINLNDFYFKK